MKNNIAVILPMYNEEDNAPLIVEHLDMVRQKNNLDLTIICVNDGSKDKTSQILTNLSKSYTNFIVLSYPTNRGLGNALRTGISKALEMGFSILFFMDADLTHDGNDIPKFIDKINDGYDLVLGSRYIHGGKMVGVPYLRVLISEIGNIAGRLLLNVSALDLTTGYRAAKAAVFKEIKLTENGFGIQLEETVKAKAAGFKIGEVPIILTTRRFGKSKMIYDSKLINSYFGLFKKCWHWSRHNG